MAKLTLSVDKDVVTEAKRYAKANNTSVSALFTNFVLSLNAPRRRMKIGPLTRKLTGIMKLPPGKDFREVLTDALMEKYEITK
jgi:hypothetical protein